MWPGAFRTRDLLRLLLRSLLGLALVACSGEIAAPSFTAPSPARSVDSPDGAVVDARTADAARQEPADAARQERRSRAATFVHGTTVDAGASIDAAAARTPVGACVSFQAVTCSVFFDDADARADACTVAHGRWLTDANCFNRDRAPLIGCTFDDRHEFFFSWLGAGTDAEQRERAAMSCGNDGGTIDP